MKKRLLWLGLFVVGLVAVGGLIVVSGVVPMKASSGHWAITRWLLEFSKQRSVATHSLGVKAPDLDDPDLILLGAGSYQTSCFSCHGSPEFPNLAVPSAMTPQPPDLRDIAGKYDAPELFSIVKHGLKFTGMPAWPSQRRDDEVWAVVAFLQKLPGMSSAEYRHWVWGQTSLEERSEYLSASGEVAFANCARCHGEDGMGRGSDAFPVLAGQSDQYLKNALEAYATGQRASGVMQPVASRLRDEEIAAMADHYAGLAVQDRPSADPSDEAIARGERIAIAGDPSRSIPACVDCHDPAGVERKDAYPILYGQSAEYIVRQLELFKGGHRGGSEFAHLMKPVVKRMTPEQMRDVAAYLSSRTR